MKFIFLLFALLFTFISAFGVTVPSLLGSIQNAERNDRVLKILEKSLESALNSLSTQTVNESNFPTDQLSDQFLRNNSPLIIDIYSKYDTLVNFLVLNYKMLEINPGFGRIKHPKKSRSLWKKIRGKYRTEEERIEGFGRRATILFCVDTYYQKSRIILYDDGMLNCLIRSRHKFEKLEDREPQLQAALKKQLTDTCLIHDKEVSNEEKEKEKEEPKVCASCFEDHSLNQLRCCGQAYHKQCLEKWWRSLESNQPFHCPLCQRTPDEIK